MYEPDIPKKVPLRTFNIQVLFSPKYAILEAFCVKKITQIIKIDFGQKNMENLNKNTFIIQVCKSLNDSAAQNNSFGTWDL